MELIGMPEGRLDENGRVDGKKLAAAVQAIARAIDAEVPKGARKKSGIRVTTLPFRSEMQSLFGGYCDLDTTGNLPAGRMGAAFANLVLSAQNMEDYQNHIDNLVAAAKKLPPDFTPARLKEALGKTNTPAYLQELASTTILQIRQAVNEPASR